MIKPKARARIEQVPTPVDFQREVRAYNEYTWLNTAGDGSQNLTTVEFRAPILDGKWQFRAKGAIQFAKRRS